MHMVRAIFKDPLSKVAGQDAIEQIFLNWDKLIELSRNIHFELKTKPAGEVFCRRIDDLEEFVRFCERQESAIEFLNGLQNKNPQFKKVYQACCQREYAKGVSLAYFLLLPMSRITRYPLIFDKMIKYSSAEDPQYETLQNTHQLLKALCARVNQALTEVENKNMLWWSQRHINCESLHSTLEFTSKTREIGPRSFLHAGILYKAKSNKLLVGLLYSDFLLLTTPIEPIVEPDTLKLTKNSDLHLQLYKTPLLMKKLMITASAEDLSFELKTADITVTLKAPNKNAKMMWTKQIEKAIEQYGVALQMKNAEEIRTYGRSSNTSNQIRIGRLVLEVVSIQDFDPKLACDGRWLTCMSGFSTSLSSDGSNDAYVWPRQKHEVDLAKNSNYFTTQMDINENMKAKDFYLALLIPMRYRPDMYIGENRIPVQELIAMSSGHPGLIMRSIRLQNGEIAASACTLNIKFFIQMFD
ncbi:pleckstrin homology domain-containing protein [Ditylenchus destructor]|uniref:Pleckstrin homology domain-containing protein n=1 Tax=Ditylenchus destructor TaxID=166010 RepID=A0AAD4R723_9BILA|nr:pleckstrin homology domain-containing protein [Ditylenchus destructor]